MSSARMQPAPGGRAGKGNDSARCSATTPESDTWQGCKACSGWATHRRQPASPCPPTLALEGPQPGDALKHELHALALVGAQELHPGRRRGGTQRWGGGAGLGGERLPALGLVGGHARPNAAPRAAAPGSCHNGHAITARPHPIPPPAHPPARQPGPHLGQHVVNPHRLPFCPCRRRPQHKRIHARRQHHRRWLRRSRCRCCRRRPLWQRLRLPGRHGQLEGHKLAAAPGHKGVACSQLALESLRQAWEQGRRGAGIGDTCCCAGGGRVVCSLRLRGRGAGQPTWETAGAFGCGDLKGRRSTTATCCTVSILGRRAWRRRASPVPLTMARMFCWRRSSSSACVAGRSAAPSPSPAAPPSSSSSSSPCPISSSSSSLEAAAEGSKSEASEGSASLSSSHSRPPAILLARS